MEKEFLTKTDRSMTLNVTGGRIDSFREQEETTGTVRVYENGCIGVAGCLGKPDETELTTRATEALALGIPYPCKLEGALCKEDLHEEEIFPVSEFLPTMQSFLDRLGNQFPRFAFSNKISLRYQRSEYRNSLGRHLLSSGRNLSIDLLIQSRGSGNLFDTFLSWSGKDFDAEAILNQFQEQYDAFYTPSDLEPGRYPVILNSSDLFGAFLQKFVGELYVAGASPLSGKLGQKVFSDKLSLRADMNPATNPGCCFFDDEGCVAPDLRPTLIEEGVLTGLLTTKKSADLYHLPNLGTAVGAYDGVPGLGFYRFYVEPTAVHLRELAPERAVYVVVASGGDITPDGHFSTPVQMAYLMQSGKLIGRLPELNIGGNFFDLLGKDFLGTVPDKPMKGNLPCAITMDVTA